MFYGKLFFENTLWGPRGKISKGFNWEKAVIAGFFFSAFCAHAIRWVLKATLCSSNFKKINPQKLHCLTITWRWGVRVHKPNYQPTLLSLPLPANERRWIFHAPLLQLLLTLYRAQSYWTLPPQTQDSWIFTHCCVQTPEHTQQMHCCHAKWASQSPYSVLRDKALIQLGFVFPSASGWTLSCKAVGRRVAEKMWDLLQRIGFLVRGQMG